MKMDELISRQAAIDAVGNMLRRKFGIGGDLAEITLADLPSAQPERGKWFHGREVSRYYIGDACVAIRYENWWCSECSYTVDDRPLWKFCPNCGAKMNGVRE